jgi:glycosyltransferase involved in cell wall biosynthesis
MKILHLSHSDARGGAGRAAFRVHRALLEAGLVSRMQVRRKLSDDWTVSGAASGLAKAAISVRGIIGVRVNALQRKRELATHSTNFLPSNWASSINRSGAEVVHVHWVNDETISIEDIGRITKPLVMTMHDMWAFCGTEHYAPDDTSARWQLGYSARNRLPGDRGIDLDRWTWRRKHRAWRRPIHVLCPSQWLADCARNSALMRSWSVAAVPNILDTATFKPLDRNICRLAWKLPIESRIVLFGAAMGGSDPRKGYDLLLEALRCWHSQSSLDDKLCVVFGQSQPRNLPELPIPVRWVGRVQDEVALALLYSAADLMIIPSRQDNLVQTGTEAQACGCPVAAFAVSGMPDVVEHGKTGYLATPYEARDLANGISWVLGDSARRDYLGRGARHRALRLWSPEILVPRYLEAYATAIALRPASQPRAETAGSVFE